MYKSADKFKRRARLVGFLFFSLLLTGVGYWFDIPFAVLGGSVLGGVVLLCFLYVALSMRRIDVFREGYHAGCQEEEVVFKTGVENRGNIPLYMPLVEDFFPPSERPSQCRLLVGLLPSGSVGEAHYSAYCFRRRGIYEMGPMRILHSDPLGLVSLERSFPRDKEFWVYPRTFPVDITQSEGKRHSFSSSFRDPSKSGRSLEYLGIREYRHGDSMRNVHWPASAHRGKLIVKQFEQYVNQQVTIIMDLLEEHQHGLGQKSTLEYQVQIAASIARQAVDEGHWVQLISRSKEKRHVPFGRGTFHLRRLLRTLVEVQQNGEESLSEVLEHYKYEIPSESFLVLLYAPVDDEHGELVNQVRFLRSRGISVCCILMDITGFMRRGTWSIDPETIQDAIKALKKELESVQVDTKVVGTELPLEEYFQGKVEEAE